MLDMKHIEKIEAEATARGIPKSELRFLIGVVIGRLLALGAPPETLKWYLTQAVDYIATLQEQLRT